MVLAAARAEVPEEAGSLPPVVPVLEFPEDAGLVIEDLEPLEDLEAEEPLDLDEEAVGLEDLDFLGVVTLDLDFLGLCENLMLVMFATIEV